MALPKIKHPSEELTLSDGSTMTVRGLSRGEALHIASLGDDVSRVEISLVSYSADVSDKEAEAWHKDTPSADIQKIVEAVIRLSGLDDSPKE